MGFKRTSEGRVFFQGGDKTANDQAETPNGQGAHMPAGFGNMQSPQMQTQIVTLLKTLNERLKATQAERNKMRRELDAYRDVIEDLEHKAERSERAYLDLEQKLSSPQRGGKAMAGDALKEMEETRRLLLSIESRAEQADQEVKALQSEVTKHQKLSTQVLKKQNLIESTQKQHSKTMQDHSSAAAQLIKRIKESEAAHDVLNEKIETTVSEQARLGRKLDKAVEERARFMRKIERIEETVLQTRDSLNAKAMVLLTDQQMAGQEDTLDLTEPVMPAAEPKSETMKRKEQNAPWLEKISFIQATSISALIVAGIIGGWAINEAQKPKLPTIDATITTAQPQALPPTQPTQNISEMDWSIEQDTSVFQPQNNASASTSASEFDDVGALDLNNSEQIEALLEDNPQAVANALNAIEPGDPEAVTNEEETIVAALPEATEPAAQAPAETETVQAAAPSSSALPSPDASLKDVVRDIETQALKGVAEAQHDLAAIYTAGHGGVKQDYKRARIWFEKAAEQGIANAAYNLGVLHHQGLGAPADITQALSWYKKAADLGHPEAQYNLGIAHIEGIGAPYDAQKAAQYFRMAADNDIMEAAYNLGLIHENGLLGKAKPDEALMWYKIASDQGSPEAKQALEQLAKTLNIKLEDVNRLAESMKAIKKNSSPVGAAPAQPKPAPVQQQPSEPAAEEPVSLQTPPQPSSTAQISQVLTAQIQEYLMNSGLYPGPADGISGPLTVDAVRSYQSKNGLNPDGQVTKDLLAHMLSNSRVYNQPIQTFNQ